MPKLTFIGQVVSDKMQNTVIVALESPKRHPVYGKIVKNTKRVKAHDELNAKIGDEVKIEECRPYSKQVH